MCVASSCSRCGGLKRAGERARGLTMDDALMAHVDGALRAHRLLTRGQRLVVAVSGGADSVALLHILTRLQAPWRLTLSVAHLDHRLRSTSSDDAEFVRSLGAQWRLPSVVESRDVAAQCAQAGWSLEDGARRVRYAFLLEVARRVSAGHIAIAQTADDQAETVLMRLLRGSGLAGLGAIPRERPLEDITVVRPLLEVWRHQVLAYVERWRLAYRQDPTNRQTRFLRNRIRHELLPLLERDYNPNVKAALTRLAWQSQSDYAYVRGAAARQRRRIMKPLSPHAVALAVAPFLRQPDALQRELIRQAIRQVQGDLTAIECRHGLEVMRLFRERPVGSQVDLPGGIRWRREADRVICEDTDRRAAAAARDGEEPSRLVVNLRRPESARYTTNASCASSARG